MGKRCVSYCRFADRTPERNFHMFSNAPYQSLLPPTPIVGEE